MDLAPLGEAAGWLAGAKVLAPFLEKIFGQAASEVGGMLADPIAEWRKDLVRRRQERLIRIGSGAAQQIKDTGTEPIMIPDYIAVPLLHRATLVDDESLQEKWASLLATAAHPQLASSISHLFPVMLASLSPRQAQFLDVVFDYSYRNISIKVRPIAASTIAAHSRMNNEKPVNAVGNSSFRWTSNEEKASALDNL